MELDEIKAVYIDQEDSEVEPKQTENELEVNQVTPYKFACFIRSYLIL